MPNGPQMMPFAQNQQQRLPAKALPNSARGELGQDIMALRAGRTKGNVHRGLSVYARECLKPPNENLTYGARGWIAPACSQATVLTILATPSRAMGCTQDLAMGCTQDM